MELKLTKLPGCSTVNVSVDNEFSKVMHGNEMTVNFEESITICDNPLNICRCIVKIEKGGK